MSAILREPHHIPDSEARIKNLYRILRTVVEESDGSWPGSDAVEALCAWFTDMGFDVESRTEDESED